MFIAIAGQCLPFEMHFMLSTKCACRSNSSHSLSVVIQSGAMVQVVQFSTIPHQHHERLLLSFCSVQEIINNLGTTRLRIAHTMMLREGLSFPENNLSDTKTVLEAITHKDIISILQFAKHDHGA